MSFYTSPFISPFIGTPDEGEEAFNTHGGQVCVPREHSHALQRVPAFLPFNYISALSVAGGKKREGWRGVGVMGGSLHTFHVVPITSAGSGAERACSSRRRVTPHLHQLTDTSIAQPQKATGGERQKKKKRKKSCPTGWDFYSRW